MGLLNFCIICVYCVQPIAQFYHSVHSLKYKEPDDRHLFYREHPVDERWIPWHGRPIDK